MMVEGKVISFPKLALIRQGSTALDRTGGQVLTWCGKSTFVRHRVGMICALIDATVLLRIGGDEDDHLPDFELTIDEAMQLEKALAHARFAAMTRLRQLSNRDGWRVVARDGERVEMVFRPLGLDKDERRWFRKSRAGMSKRRRGCDGCRQLIGHGDVVYRPETKLGWGDSNFGVRLCERCASAPVQGLRRIQ